MESKARYQIFNSFWIKIFALLFMTIDHIGQFMYFKEVATGVANVFTTIGRLGFPLFILLLVEGVRHTHNYGKYLLRLGIVAAVVMAAQIVIHYGFEDINGFYSPMIDLVVLSLILYLFKRNDKFTWLAALPILYVLLSFVVMAIEQGENIQIHWLPFYLRTGYSIYGLLLGLGFYFAYPLAKVMMKNFGNGMENMTETYYYRLLVNAIMCFVVFLSVLLIYLIAMLPGCDVFTIKLEAYSMCAVAFIFLYNGERGYNKKWFQYGAYAYFPLHIVIIYAIFALI